MLASYCVKGKVKISVAITRSSIPLNADDDQINAHRLSDWTPIELEFKNPHPKCQVAGSASKRRVFAQKSAKIRPSCLPMST